MYTSKSCVNTSLDLSLENKKCIMQAGAHHTPFETMNFFGLPVSLSTPGHCLAVEDDKSLPSVTKIPKLPALWYGRLGALATARRPRRASPPRSARGRRTPGTGLSRRGKRRRRTARGTRSGRGTGDRTSGSNRHRAARAAPRLFLTPATARRHCRVPGRGPRSRPEGAVDAELGRRGMRRRGGAGAAAIPAALSSPSESLLLPGLRPECCHCADE